jgi:drug/metabolite transporter (DMT)-like permease
MSADATSPASGLRRADTMAVVALIAGAFAMGVSPVFVKLASQDGVGPFASAFWRCVLGLPVLYAWARLEDRGRSGGARPTFTKPALISGLLFGGDLLFWHVSIVNTTVANATFFATSAPIWVVLVSWLLYRKKIRAAVIAGLALCILGGFALVGNSMQVDPSRIKGDVFGLITAIFFGLYFFAVGDARKLAGAGRVTFGMSFVAAAIVFVAAIMAGDNFLPGSWGGLAALIGMGVISHAGGQGLLAVALGRLPTIFSSLVIFLESIAAALVAWLALGEALTLTQALGGALILAGVWVARPRRDGD